MSDENKHGLSRYITSSIRRTVRRRSKFGCVICRSGFYQYHHFFPPFEDAIEHNPSQICCLCPGCHARVTCGQMSNEAVAGSYAAIQQNDRSTIEPPTGPLDFYGGSAQLLLGGIRYVPLVRTLLRYHGDDLITVHPGSENRPGSISAVFTDDAGRVTMLLHHNEWQGAVDAWDIEVIGKSLKVRSAARRIALHLSLEPPGKIVVERLDMRVYDAHILVSRYTSAIGRYVTDDELFWLHARVDLLRGSEAGSALEFESPEILQARFEQQKNSGGQYMANGLGSVIGNQTGATVISSGMSIGPMCGAIAFTEMAQGTRKLSEMREVLFSAPEQVSQFIGTGKRI